ncbi:ion transporter [Algoriphagus sp.]|uniref:ion transporter n=1 Tax=Algoriphagus sp. TaxID=1872435 RepID=UPI00391AB1CD
MIKKIFLNEFIILFLIILNAVIIFISGFDLGEKNNYTLSLIDNGVTIVFLLELAVKINHFGKSYFNTNWNRFDFLLILLSIPALIAFILGTDIFDFSFILVFRVMRVFKSFRFLKFIPGIDHLIRGIQRALKASIIVMFGFMIYIFIVGIFSFYLFKEITPEYFENPMISLYSIFKIFTIEGWFEIPEQVTSNLSPIKSFFTYIYFIFVVLSGGILGLSLVNSIFVDAMVSDNNDELEIKMENLEQKIDKILNKLNK